MESLQFQDNQCRPLRELLPLLQEAFAHVIVDSRRGAEYLAGLMKGLQSTDVEYQEYLDLFPETCDVILTDDRQSDESFLKLVHMPNGRVDVLFVSSDHRRISAHLLGKLLIALNLEPKQPTKPTRDTVNFS